MTDSGCNKRYPEKDAVNVKELEGVKEMEWFAEHQVNPHQHNRVATFIAMAGLWSLLF